jgi:hypothetical protein
MNSLTELNNYINNLSFEYVDDRLPNVIFDRLLAQNQNYVANEGQAFPLSVGIEILEIISPAQSQPVITIDLSSVTAEGVTLSLPAGTPETITLTEDSPGIYRILGVESAGQWDIVKQSLINLPTNIPDAFFGNFTYTVNISYYNPSLILTQQEYTVAVSVLDVLIMSNPFEFIYETNATTAILFTPQILDYDAEYPGATWTVVGTVSLGTSIVSFSSTSTSGGTFTFNSSTKGFSIVGTRAQVNAHLSALRITSNTNEIDFVLYYTVTNNQGSPSDTVQQNLKNSNIEFLSNPTSATFFYTEDTLTTVTGTPLITDTSYTGPGNYTLTITPDEPNKVFTLSTTGSGSGSFNSSTKVYTIVGTKTQVNGRLLTLKIQPESDVDTPFNLIYSLTTPNTDTATKIQQMVCGSTDNEVTNMSLARTYLSNNVNSIFQTNTPSITDFDTTGIDTYTIFLQSTLGGFSVDGLNINNPYSFTGTRAQVNALFPTIKFYPIRNVSSNGTITYTQVKNGVTQVVVSIPMTGQASTYSGTRVVSLTATQTYIPLIEDARYGKIDRIMLIGGGGGGGAGNGPHGGGGGGGGGVYYSTSDITLTEGNSYSITIGLGGSGGISNGAGGNGGSTSGFGLSAGGGGGGSSGTGGLGNGGSSGASTGSSFQDHTGLTGGAASSALNSSNGRNGGGGAGHLSINSGLAVAGTASSGGRGGFGFDEPDGNLSYWGAGGGGGGIPTRGSAGNASVSGQGGNASLPPTTGVNGTGGGGGGGFGSQSGARGGDGVIRIHFVSK